MKVLMVEPGKTPYEAEIEGGLNSLQAAGLFNRFIPMRIRLR